MSIVRFSGLLGKAVIASAFFLNIFSPEAMGMSWFGWKSLNESSSEKSEWESEKDQFKEWFNNQEYEKLFKRLSYFLQNEHQEAFDWISARVYEDHDVACTYELVRCCLKGNLFGDEGLYDMLALVILSLVQTKADVDSCTNLTLKYWSDCNPYDIIRLNYYYRLQSRKLVQQCSYETVLNRAKEMFSKISLKDLPLPIWVPTVDYGRTEYRVYFGHPSYLDKETAERAQWRKSYTFKNISNEVYIIRKASFKNTWEKLSTLTNWDEFFKLEACNFPELPVEELSDLSTSCINFESHNNNRSDFSNNDTENLVSQTKDLTISHGALDLNHHNSNNNNQNSADITQTLPWNSESMVENQGINIQNNSQPEYDYIDVQGVRTPVLRKTVSNNNNNTNNDK